MGIDHTIKFHLVFSLGTGLLFTKVVIYKRGLLDLKFPHAEK